MSGRVSVSAGENVLGDRVEDGGVLAKDGNVKDLLGIVEAEVLQLGVETGPLGTKVGDAQRGGDAGAGDEDNVGALVDELDGVLDRVVAGELGALGQLACDGERQQAEVGIVRLAFEESRSADAKGAEELPGRVATSVDGALAEDGGAILSELPTKSASLLGCANLRV